MSVHSRKRRRMDSGNFDLVVVGCGGGHDETNLSAYLLKPRDKQWSDGILGLEAGSGYGALKQLFGSTHPHLFKSLFKSQSSKHSYSATDKAHTVFTHLRAYLISHAHLDHCASLIISSGSLPGPTRHILGAQTVLEDLERCIWRPGKCWPRIVGWDHSNNSNTAGGILRALKLAPSTGGIGDRDEEYVPIGAGLDDLVVRIAPVSHGYVEADPIPAPPSSKSSAPTPPASPCTSTRPLLLPIWSHTAHLFTSNRLHTLLIECSYPAGRLESQMFGHLSVEGLRKEIKVLADEVSKLRPNGIGQAMKPRPRISEANSPQSNGTAKVRTSLRHSLKRKPSSDLPYPHTRSFTKPLAPSLAKSSATSTTPGPLTGLRVIVTHCKEPPPGFDLQGAPSIADYIVRQLKHGAGGLGPDATGVEYVAAHQGDEFGELPSFVLWRGDVLYRV